MSRSLSRRSFTLGSVATIFGGVAASSSAIHLVAAKEGDLASLGLPTLDLTMTETGFEGMPETVEAGRYLVSVAVLEGLPEGGGADFVSPPAGMTTQEWLDQLGLFGGGGAPEASPEGMGMEEAPGSPEAGAEDGEESVEFLVPSFVYQSHWAGGAVGPGGTTAQSVIDLVEGDWILLADDPFGSQAPVPFTVTGDFPMDVTEPDADITVTFIDFAISVEGNLTAGDHTLLLQNNGAQPHFLVLVSGPDTMTDEGLEQVFSAFMSGEMTPEAMPFNPEELQDVMSSAAQSIDTRQWVTATLEAGTYGALCFFPTAGEGLPHALHGMHTVFNIE